MKQPVQLYTRGVEVTRGAVLNRNVRWNGDEKSVRSARDSKSKHSVGRAENPRKGKKRERVRACTCLRAGTTSYAHREPLREEERVCSPYLPLEKMSRSTFPYVISPWAFLRPAATINAGRSTGTITRGSRNLNARSNTDTERKVFFSAAPRRTGTERGLWIRRNCNSWGTETRAVPMLFGTQSHTSASPRKRSNFVAHFP